MEKFTNKNVGEESEPDFPEDFNPEDLEKLKKEQEKEAKEIEQNLGLTPSEKEELRVSLERLKKDNKKKAEKDILEVQERLKRLSNDEDDR